MADGMAEIRDGEGGRRRRRRLFRSHPKRSDYEYSEDYTISSDTDAVHTGRKNTDLEDALFGLLRNQAVESLKRNFTDHCKDSMATIEAKRNKSVGVGKNAFTRFGSKYFFHVLKKLTPEQKSIVQKFGFGCLLFFDCSSLPSDFCNWVANCIDPVCSQLTVG